MPARRSALPRDITLLESFWREEVLREVLPNGLTLIMKPDNSAELVSVQVWVKTGSIHEGDLLGSGASHFLEHMLFKGTSQRSGRQISADVQARGGYVNAYTTFDRTVYYIDLPSEHLDAAIDILSDAVLNSTLPEDEIAREREVILREIAMTRDDPDQRLGERLFETAFRVHPYRYPIIGHKDVLSGLARADLERYYRARYAPNNIVVVIVGAVEPARALDQVAARFGRTPRARLAPVLVPDEPAQLASRSVHLAEEVEICRAAMAWRIPGLTHADAPLFDLLGTILGSGDSSVLWQRIRERAGLVHSIDAHAWNPGSTGLFTISYTCDPGKREQAADAVRSELARIARGGVTGAQLSRALRQLVVGEINTRKTMSGQASRLGAAEVVAGDLQFSRSFFERIGRAGPADLRRIVREHLVPPGLSEVSSSPLSPGSAPQATRGRAAGGEFEEIQLGSGARILLQPDHRLPNLHLRLACAGGPMFEHPGKRGASSLLATLLTKDTRRRFAAQAAAYIESVGGSFYPFCGNNSLGLAVEVLPGDVTRALSVLREGAFHPAFSGSTFKTEREAQMAELKLDADDVVTQGRKELRSRFFGTYPLAIDSHGDIAGLSALAPADLRDLHGELFVAPRLVLAVSGDFKRDALLPRLEELLRDAASGTAAPASGVFAWPAASEHELRLPREQAVVFHAYPGPTLLADDFYVGEVADELFSGMASRLFERVREEKGLAYFVRSARVTGLGGAMFYFYAGTAPEKTGEVLREIELEIERVAGGDVLEEELQRCITRLKAGRRQSMQTSGARALNAALNVLFGLPVNDWKRYDERVTAVGIRDLAAFAGRYFKRDLRTQLVVRP